MKRMALLAMVLGAVEQTHLRGRDMITTQEWTKDEIDTVLEIALDLKRRRALGEEHALLRDKVLARGSGLRLPCGRGAVRAATFRAQTGPWWAAVVFAASLPLGLELDAATNLFPFGELFFFAGFGFYLGLGLFALSLIRLGVAARRQELGQRQGGRLDPTQPG